jgi:predicted RNA-binding protein with PIN domain
MFEREFFYCYSINLYREIKKHSIRYIAKGKSIETERRFWQYKFTPELRAILDKWSKNKN